MSRQRRSKTAGPCPICGLPKRCVTSSRGRQQTRRMEWTHTCGSGECIKALMCRKREHWAKRTFKPKLCAICKNEFAPNSSQAITCPTCTPTTAERRLFKIYGLTKKAWEELKARTNGQCAICERSGSVVDHDHITGEVRGWLCNGCNTALAVLEKPTEWQEKASAYLNKVRK